ncbi:inositol phosphorylceramide synthase [Aeromicrobium flavum]|uniref:Inositol phosphorylceramide synthase n=1 Tax=Aeromicrobium flavum TaxID=416568 RepID=A0A512HZ03_9ACTN|nr:phosphatase PAP2 family protein [Aeromicrobium flavum]GEO90668.1 inositol phosphorylceramide synthase [Aeromicrobium flavum]
MPTSRGTAVLTRLRVWVVPAVFELVLLSLVYLLYRTGRLVTIDSQAAAMANAEAVHRLERFLRLPSEAAVQGLVPTVDLWQFANVYYVAVHFPVTVAFLLWGFFRRPRAEYRWARNLIILMTSIAVLLHIAYPLAPPRMFAQWGFVDTMSVYGPSAYDGASGAVANQYAAMPSLHVGWAVLIAVVVARTASGLVRRLAIWHAGLTLVVVTVTANHWYMDGLVACGLLGLGLALFPSPGQSRSRVLQRIT